MSTCSGSMRAPSRWAKSRWWKSCRESSAAYSVLPTETCESSTRESPVGKAWRTAASRRWRSRSLRVEDVEGGRRRCRRLDEERVDDGGAEVRPQQHDAADRAHALVVLEQRERERRAAVDADERDAAVAAAGAQPVEDAADGFGDRLAELAVRADGRGLLVHDRPRALAGRDERRAVDEEDCVGRRRLRRHKHVLHGGKHVAHASRKWRRRLRRLPPAATEPPPNCSANCSAWARSTQGWRRGSPRSRRHRSPWRWPRHELCACCVHDASPVVRLHASSTLGHTSMSPPVSVGCTVSEKP